MSRENSKKKKKQKKKLQMLRTFLHELEWSVTKKYVEHLRKENGLLQLGAVDVDVAQIVRRRFECDAQRCIQWSGQTPLVDRSCCCRYGVPVSSRDRDLVLEKLDEVRLNLPDEHRLQDPSNDPFVEDDARPFHMRRGAGCR